jgi:hypothetical protein
MAGKGARTGRRLRRELSHGRLVELLSFEEDHEIYSCGHTAPLGPKREGEAGKIMRHCKECVVDIPTQIYDRF